MDKKNILVVGAGISGSTISRLFAEEGHNVTIIEKSDVIGGNCHDYYDDKGILVHKYGPHIFHTNYDDVWKFVNKFARFNKFVNKVLVSIDDKLVQMPINFNSIKKIFSKEKYKKFVEECKSFSEDSISIFDLKNRLKNESSLEIVNYIYKNVYENYTSKMWGIPIDKVDPDTLKRVKINLNKIWNYFPNDKYQGLPIGGYTSLITNILDHKNINTVLKTDFLEKAKIKNNKIIYDNKLYDLVIYTCMIDELFSYKYGELPYRSLNIKFETINKTKFQPTAVVNYPSDPKITRITEYKNMTLQKIRNWTTISYEEPGSYNRKSNYFNKAFYPINNAENMKIYDQYLNDVKKLDNLLLLGRLSNYRYIDMDDSIKNAFDLFHEIKNK